MKQQFKTEWERMISGRMLWIAIIAGCTISLIQIIMEVYPASENIIKYYSGRSGEPKSLFTYWIGMNAISPYGVIYRTVLPILAMMPHALSYHMDIKSGYVKNIYTRTKKNNYLVAKYVVTFLGGGIAVVIPYLLNLIISACMLPALTPIRNGQFQSASSLFQEIFYSEPLVYLLIQFVILFIFAGVFATTVLAATYIVDNIFLLSMVSFILWYGLKMIYRCMIFEGIHYKIDPEIYVKMWDTSYKMYGLILLPVLFGTISFAFYYINGVKSDAL